MKFEDLKPIFDVFEDIEKQEMVDFMNDFASMYPMLAKELMEELEGKVIRKVADHLDWWRQKEICFFTEENEQIIKTKIKQAVWRVIIEDLKDYWL